MRGETLVYVSARMEIYLASEVCASRVWGLLFGYWVLSCFGGFWAVKWYGWMDGWMGDWVLEDEDGLRERVRKCARLFCELISSFLDAAGRLVDKVIMIIVYSE